MQEALFYSKEDGKKVLCKLCPHYCILDNGKTGRCKARKNIDGMLFSLNFGKVSSLAFDPIEKKPLNRFFPGTKILSAGTFGCNLKCSFCQNWPIAQEMPHTEAITSSGIISIAMQHKNCIGIAYTYNEPLIWYEFVLETAKLAHESGLKNVLVTNGFVNNEPLRELLPYIDAMNIDLKGYGNNFYSKICGGDLESVKSSIRISAAFCHIEITTLIIPGLNDSIDEISKLSSWLAGISPEIPLHLTRFFPNYKLLDVAPTPIETLIILKKEAEKNLRFVYIGNV